MKFFTFTILGAACFIPAMIIGYANRPTSSPIFNEPSAAVSNTTVPFSYVENEHQQIPTSAPSKKPIWKKVKTPEPAKSYCRERELLSGGRVQICDSIPSLAD